MDKQQSDHIDNIIRNAAEHVSVPFKEEAWVKMELLLDKELKKDRRPAILWWWILLLLLGLGSTGYYFFIYHPSDRHTGTHDNPASVQKNAAGEATARMEKPLPHHRQASTARVHPPGQAKLPAEPGAPVQNPTAPGSMAKTVHHQQTPATGQDMAVVTVGRHRAPRAGFGNRRRPGRQSVSVAANHDAPAPDHQATRDDQVITGQPDPDQQRQENEKHNNKQQESTVAAAPAPLTPESRKAKDTATTAAAQLKAPKLQQPGKNERGFYYLAAVARNATDVKSITSNNLGYVFGAGVGYQLSGRWRVQTGFYAGRKIYKAGPDDYHTKEGSLYNATIKSLNADCYIYDIPLSVRYDVVHKRSFNVYGMAGISSFIMKKENYMYHYNDASGRYGFLDTTYRGNVNVFSVMNVAVGVEQKVFTGLYVQLEPYIKMPLSGIGEGKVKLYDAGLQLGIRYQPFRKKKAH